MLHKGIYRLIASCIAVLLIFGLCSCQFTEAEFHIFASIEECESISTENSVDTEVTIFKSIEEDPYLKELEFLAWFGCEYSSEKLSFELFAYEFLSNDIAMDYFENVTGKDNDPNPTFLDSSGNKYFSRIVVSENKAYIVTCEKTQKDALIAFLNSHFSVIVDIGANNSTGDSSVC